MELRDRLKQRRRERGVKQSELAAQLNVSQEMVSMMESGAKEIPAELVPIIRRWIATGQGPSKSALSARTRARHDNSSKGR